MTAPKNYREYASSLDAGARSSLGEIRETLAAALPKATETISYGLPAFEIDGKKLVWFAAFKKHVGFYPGSAAIAKFTNQLTRYKTAKGSVQFPYDSPLPRTLVSRMARYAAVARQEGLRRKSSS